MDLFGEERGSTTLSDIKEAELSPSDENAFYILLEDGGKRIFSAPTKEEAARWVHCIQTAIRSRYLYRRETLSGLSFIHAMEGTEADVAVRPRLFLLTHTRKEEGREEGKEVVVSRHVDYEKGLPLPPLKSEDEVCLFLMNGASVTMKGKDVLASVGSSGSGSENEEKKMKVPLKGGSGGGMAGAMLVLNASAIAVQPKEEGGKEGGASSFSSSSSSSASSSLQILLQVENAIPLLCAVFLLLALLTADTCPSSASELLRDRKAGAMVFVSGGLILLALTSSSRARQQEEAEAAAATATAAAAVAAAAKKKEAVGETGGVYLEVEDYIPPKPVVVGEEGGRRQEVATPATAAAAGGGGGGGEGGGEGGLPIPQRFIDGCLGDMTEANRRWTVTCEWR